MYKIQVVVIIFLLSLISTFAQNKPYKKYKVEAEETIQSVCKKLSITPYKLLQLNPEIKNNNNLDGITILIVPNKEYRPVSVSGEHVDYVKDGFLYHKLLPKETYSKLKREYGVAKKQLRRFNSELRFGGLKAGKIIKIPVPYDFKLPSSVASNSSTESNNTKPYIVKSKENKWRIAKRYNITIEELEALNPGIKEEGLKADTIILVPNVEEVPEDVSFALLHRVEKGDTFFNLGERFGVGESQLIEVNPELKDGLKVGMLIKIPTTSFIKTKEFTPLIKHNQELNVVFLLPFMSNNNSVDFETTGIDKTAGIATDYYLGASMALDSLKKQGLTVNVKTFDTQNSKTKITSIFTALDLTDVDVIIGPMFYGNLELVSRLTRGRNIPIISPVSKRDHSSMNSTTVIQEVPSETELSEKVLSYINTKYDGQNLILIGDDKEESKSFLVGVKEKLEALDSTNTVTLIKPEKGYIKRTLFLDNIKKGKENFVILVTDDEVVTTDVINNLGSLSEKLKVTLFALKRGDNFNESKGINNQLAHVNFHYPEYSFIDHNNGKTTQFISRYKQLNFAEPTEYSFKGFDTTYDALLRFASFNTIENALNAGFSERMSTKFNYKNNAGKGFVNSGVYLVKYDGLNLVKVE